MPARRVLAATQFEDVGDIHLEDETRRPGSAKAAGPAQEPATLKGKTDQSEVTSATAARAEASSTIPLPSAKVATKD
jgi:hypothetical protein